MNTGDSIGSDSSVRRVMVCQPGGSSDSSTTSTTPPLSAVTRCWIPPMSTMTATSFTGTLVKLRHPRIFLERSSVAPGLASSTRQSTRTQPGAP